MAGVRLRVEDEGKCVSSYCLFDIESGGDVTVYLILKVGGGRLKFSLKMWSSSIFEKLE